MKNLENSVEQYHQNLHGRIQSWLKNERGLNNEVIENGHLDPDDKLKFKIAKALDCKSVEEIFPEK